MGEYVGDFDIAQAEIAALGGAGTIKRVIEIPQPHRRWSIYVCPLNSAGSPSAINTSLEYDVGTSSGSTPDDKTFLPTNPASMAVANLNEANTITREDVTNRVRLVVDFGATPPDGDTLVRLFVDRNN